MLLVGGYPGIHNKMNLSTLYTFVNGQKKYFYKDYNVMDNLYNNYRADISSDGTRCEDNYGIVYIDYDVPFSITGSWAYAVLYVPTLTIGGAVVKKYYNTFGYNDEGLRAFSNGCGIAYATQTINVDGVNKIVVWFWPDARNGQKVALHTQNWFFEYVYNGGDYSISWSKNGALLQRTVNNTKEFYFMFYNNLSQVLPIEDIPSNFNLFGSLYDDRRCICSAPQDEIYWSKDSNQLLYMKDDKVRYVLDSCAPEGSYSTKIAVYGRYSYGYNGNKMYCKDMLTGEQVQWTCPANSSWSNWVDLYHPTAGIKNTIQSATAQLIKFDKFNEPITKTWPFTNVTQGTNLACRTIRLFGNTYRMAVITQENSTTNVCIYYIDDNLDVQTITTNLPYNSSHYYRFVSDRYGCIIVAETYGGGDSYVKNYYYSWDGVNFTAVANG